MIVTNAKTEKAASAKNKIIFVELLTFLIFIE
jgi:hypothetical protein